MSRLLGVSAAVLIAAILTRFPPFARALPAAVPALAGVAVGAALVVAGTLALVALAVVPQFIPSKEED